VHISKRLDQARAVHRGNPRQEIIQFFRRHLLTFESSMQHTGEKEGPFWGRRLLVCYLDQAKFENRPPGVSFLLDGGVLHGGRSFSGISGGTASTATGAHNPAESIP
jgi:hypothetical protein